MEINDLVHEAGTNSRDHGFHDDWPDFEPHEQERYQRQLSLAITEKLALIHEEISEALGEIRSGHDPLKVYYTEKVKGPAAVLPKSEKVTFHDRQWLSAEDGRPMRKPEGFMIELADVVIRIADLAYLVGGDLEAAIAEKHEYNRTRPYKHGRKF